MTNQLSMNDYKWLFDRICHDDVKDVARLLSRESLRAQIDQKATNMWVASLDGLTPLGYACLLGRYDIAYVLIMHGGADPNVCDDNNESPLHHSLDAHYKLFASLLAAGAKVPRSILNIPMPLHDPSRRRTLRLARCATISWTRCHALRCCRNVSLLADEFHIDAYTLSHIAYILFLRTHPVLLASRWWRKRHEHLCWFMYDYNMYPLVLHACARPIRQERKSKFLKRCDREYFHASSDSYFDDMSLSDDHEGEERTEGKSLKRFFSLIDDWIRS